MKKIKSFIFIFLLGVGSLLAQTPGAFNYQAVLRDTEGKIISNQDVSIQISILQQSASGEIVFQEKHSTNTNEFGLIVLEIGNGLPLTGTLAEINWGESTHFLKVELDATGGESYVEMGTSQMLSVPYALYAKSSGSNFSGKYSDLEGTPDLPNDISDLSDVGKLLFDGDYNSLINKPDLSQLNSENTDAWDKDVTDDFDGDYNSLTNKPTTISTAQATAIDANTAKVSNVKADWNATSGEAQILNKPDLTVYVEETNTANWDKNAADDFDGDYNNLTNKPTTISAAQVTAIDANSAKISNVKADWSATTGEAQILNKPDLTVFVEEANTANWDKDAADDFDGDYNNLTNKPTTISAAQATAIDANTAKVSNVKADWDATTGEAQILNKPDLTVYVEETNTANWDKNASDDFDGNYNNLTNKPTTISAAQATAIDANTAKVSNVKADWIATTGEAQILNKPDLTVYVEETNTSGWDKNAADDFDGDYNNLTSKPTTISAAQATAIDANTAKVSNVKADWNATTGEAQILNKPDLTVYVEEANTSGWDKNASDDFSGSFNDLSDVPANLDVDDSDDFDGDYNNLINKPTTISAAQANNIVANTAKISNVQANWDATSGDAQILNKPDLSDLHSHLGTGENSFIGGGIENTAAGLLATTSGGQKNTASGYYSTIAGGYSNTAAYAANVGGGTVNKALGYHSTVVGGQGNTAWSYGETVMGFYSPYYAAESISEYKANDRLFVIANGTGDGARSNALVMLKNGNTTLNGELTINNGQAAAGNGYTLPTARGTDGQFLTTDGAGATQWASISKNASINTISSSYGIQQDDGFDVILSDGQLVVLPSPSQNNGRVITVKNTGTTSVTVDQQAIGVDKIDGQDNWELPNQYDAIKVISDGTQWHILSEKTQGHSHSGNEYDNSFIGVNNSNTATGGYSAVVAGNYNTSSGNTSAILGGSGNIASGVMATIVTGFNNKALAQGSFVTNGIENIAVGDFSVAIGARNNSAQSYGEIVLGMFNDTLQSVNSRTSYNANDRLLVVGNGSGPARSNALVMLKNGNTTLNGDLTVNGTIKSNVLSTSTDYSMTDDDGYSIIISNGANIVLPDPPTNVNRVITIKNRHYGNTISINTSSDSYRIDDNDGVSWSYLLVAYSSAKLVSDGSHWWILEEYVK